VPRVAYSNDFSDWKSVSGCTLLGRLNDGMDFSLCAALPIEKDS
jgi:hypothetical protein